MKLHDCIVRAQKHCSGPKTASEISIIVELVLILPAFCEQVLQHNAKSLSQYQNSTASEFGYGQ
jgi:hypothetical protein